MFECPQCQISVSFLPRYQTEINRRYADICDISDFFFAAATGSGLKERLAVLQNKIHETSEGLKEKTNFSIIGAKAATRLLSIIEKAIQEGSRRAAAAKVITSRDVALWESQVDIVAVLISVTFCDIKKIDGCRTFDESETVDNSHADDSSKTKRNDDDFLSTVIEYIANCTAISRPMMVLLIVLLRTRGDDSAAQRLKEEMTIRSYERDLWRRCGLCRAFYQTTICSSGCEPCH